MSLEQVRKKLEDLEARYEQLNEQMMDPVVTSNIDQYRSVSRSWSDLGPVVLAWQEYCTAERAAGEAQEMLGDPEMKDLARTDLELQRGTMAALEEKLKLLLLTKDPNDDKNVILEIRPAAGGEEAALFAGELFRMYSRYAERRGWKVEVLNALETGIGGFADVTLGIEAQGAYSQLKFESGVHRVQRVPATESSGRIHTSTATVAVLPEAEEVDVQLDMNDIEMDVYHASSAGGQNVQKVATAIRILHKPTGLVVTCQDERSQFQNKEKAFRMLRARLYERQQMEQTAERKEARRGQIGSGDRSEKIRTYNFPDGRVTDHRVGLTIHNVPGILEGDIQAFIDALVATDQAKRLREQTED